MIDREKVIKGLEWIVDLFGTYDRHAMDDEEIQSLNDAITLLKEQEPVKPIEQTDTITRYNCGFCGNRLFLKENHCHWCGREIKWNDKS